MRAGRLPQIPAALANDLNKSVWRHYRDVLHVQLAS